MIRTAHPSQANWRRLTRGARAWLRFAQPPERSFSIRGTPPLTVFHTRSTQLNPLPMPHNTIPAKPTKELLIISQRDTALLTIANANGDIESEIRVERADLTRALSQILTADARELAAVPAA